MVTKPREILTLAAVLAIALAGVFAGAEPARPGGSATRPATTASAPATSSPARAVAASNKLKWQLTLPKRATPLPQLAVSQDHRLAVVTAYEANDQGPDQDYGVFGKMVGVSGETVVYLADLTTQKVSRVIDLLPDECFLNHEKVTSAIPSPDSRRLLVTLYSPVKDAVQAQPRPQPPPPRIYDEGEDCGCDRHRVPFDSEVDSSPTQPQYESIVALLDLQTHKLTRLSRGPARTLVYANDRFYLCNEFSQCGYDWTGKLVAKTAFQGTVADVSDGGIFLLWQQHTRGPNSARNPEEGYDGLYQRFGDAQGEEFNRKLKAFDSQGHCLLGMDADNYNRVVISAMGRFMVVSPQGVYPNPNEPVLPENLPKTKVYAIDTGKAVTYRGHFSVVGVSDRGDLVALVTGAGLDDVVERDLITWDGPKHPQVLAKNVVAAAVAGNRLFYISAVGSPIIESIPMPQARPTSQPASAPVDEDEEETAPPTQEDSPSIDEDSGQEIQPRMLERLKRQLLRR